MKTSGTRSRILVAAALLVVSAAAFTAVARAQDGGPTRGDAEAAFRAAFTGGATIVVHRPEAEGAPFQFFSGSADGVRIRPFADGAAYCEAGWHAVILGWLEATADWGGRAETLEVLASLVVQFRLDGAPLEVVRSQTAPVKGGLFGIDGTTIGVTFGAFLPPGSVALGLHTLETDVTIGPFVLPTETVSFTFVEC